MRNVILGQEEVYTANPNVWSFKRVRDIVNGINLRLSNMAGGFPFEFNGTTWADSERLYLCGQFSCRKIIGRRRMKGQLLEISCYYDWEEDALRDVIVHEMIHYYLAYKHIDNYLTHGEEFQKMAKELNTKYGLNVTVKVDTSKFKRAPSAPKLSYYLACIF